MNYDRAPMPGCMGKTVKQTHQETQLSLTPRDAFRGQSRSPDMVPFHMLRMVSYYCSIVTLSVRHEIQLCPSLLEIRLQKCRDLENRVTGPSRSLIMSPFDTEPMTSYWCSIITMAISRVVSEIFNVEKYRDLEIRVRGYSRSLSLKMVPFNRLNMVSY